MSFAKPPPKTIVRRMPYGWRPNMEVLTTIPASTEADFPPLGVGRIYVEPTVGAWAARKATAAASIPSPVTKIKPSKQSKQAIEATNQAMDIRWWDEMSDSEDEDDEDTKYAKRIQEKWGDVAGVWRPS
jgi:hypothetical protein